MLLPTVAWHESIMSRKLPALDLGHCGLVLTREALVDRWAFNRVATVQRAAEKDRHRAARRLWARMRKGTQKKVYQLEGALVRSGGNVRQAAAFLGWTYQAAQQLKAKYLTAIGVRSMQKKLEKKS